MIRTSSKSLLFLALLTSGFSLWAKEGESPVALPHAAGESVLASSNPTDNARDVSLSDQIAVQFSQRMDVSTLNEATITLLGPSGPTPIDVKPYESGQQVAVQARQELLPGSRYTLFVSKAKSLDGAELPLASIAFTTKVLNAGTLGAGFGTSPSSGVAKSDSDAAAVTAMSGGAGALRVSAGTTEAIAALQTGCDSAKTVRGYRFCHHQGNVLGGVFTPGYSNTDSRWRTNVPLPKLPKVEDFSAAELPAGVTSLFGTVRRIDDQPLANVTVSIGEQHAKTDANGRFILSAVPSGHQVLIVDGSSANRGDEEYGQFPVAVELEANQANAVPHNLFVPRISARDKVALASPTTAAMVITHPAIPGLEIHIPAGAVLRDRNGKVLTEFAIVPLPADRSPVPLPANFQQYFSVQPGGASIEGLSGSSASGLRTVYPNYAEQPASQQQFYYYDADHDGWTIYGKGQPSVDGRTVATSEPWGSQTFMPQGVGSVGGNATKSLKCGETDGDPVDCATGAFFHSVADLTINDVKPVAFTRTYVSIDTSARSFGRGAKNAYEMYLYAPNQGCADLSTSIGNEVDLVAADGVVYPFFIPAGASFTSTNAVHTSTPTHFFGAMLNASHGVTSVQLTDGTVYRFQTICPSVLISITDRFGNKTNVYNNAGLVSEVTLPGGGSVNFTYNGDNEISQMQDSSGRSVGYAYNAAKQLSIVTYPDATTEQYTYDANGNMLTVTDRRGNAMVTNQYDVNQRVSQQTYADGSAYHFAYSLSNSSVVASDVTDASGTVKHTAFDVNGYPTSITKAYGTALAQTTTYQRFFGEFVTSKTDALGRTTTMTYDSAGDMMTRTFLAGTPSAVTYSYTYTPDYHQVATATDPLGHTATYGYTNGCLTSVQDPLGHATTITCNPSGQPLTITDALGHTTTLGYLGTSLRTTTDPLSHTTTFTTDNLGRVTAVVDPLGRESRVTYDANSLVVRSVDPMNQATTYTYDGNGSLLTVTDPNGGVTHYGYDQRNRRNSRTDALNQAESWTYDGMGNVLTYTDRKSQQTTYQYDALNRPTLVTYADGSTVVPTFDAGNRLVQVVDSVSGTITHGYDDFDRLLQEGTPQGTVFYTYDAAGRRNTMAPANQPLVTYSYDNSDRLTSISQGAETVGISYDVANRRTSLTLPNGIVTTYSYDDANEVTGIAYTSGTTTLATLAYGYDAAGQRISQTGGLVADLLPTPTAGTNTFDLNNRQALWNGFSLNYDVNGDPATNDAANQTYTFDVRHRLTQIQQGGSAIASFAYDTFGRRTIKTIGSVTTSFLYDGQNAVQEAQGGTISAILTGMGIDERFARDDSAGRYYFLTDALGSTVALADASATVQQVYGYEPYGESSATGSSNNPYQYTGRENDGTGLYYYRARYYSPSLKRFVSEDPTGMAAGLNGYAYVGSDPVLYVDPLGLKKYIWLPPNDPEYSSAQNAPDLPGQTLIITHGSPDGQTVMLPDGRFHNAEDAWELIKEYPPLPITLHACYAGKGSNPIAKQLHDLSHRPVTAPNAWAFYSTKYGDWLVPYGQDVTFDDPPNDCGCQ